MTRPLTIQPALIVEEAGIAAMPVSCEIRRVAMMSVPF
jgi:hypothetical protein